MTMPSIDRQINLATVDKEQEEDKEGFLEKVFGGDDVKKKNNERGKKGEKADRKEKEQDKDRG